MGLLLLGSGAGLLYAQFNQVAALDLVAKWWPVILILLGAEILLQNFLNKDTDSKIKYDGFSIFIVLIIVFVGLGIYSASEVGLIARARTELNSQTFTVPKTAEIPLEQGITSLVLDTGGIPVKIDSAPASSILVRSTLQVRAQSRTEAESAAAGSGSIWQHRAGNTLYLSLNPAHGEAHVWDQNNTIIVPDNINAKIDFKSGPANLSLDSIAGNWSLMEPGSCSIQVGSEANLLINAVVSHADAIGGNLSWTKTPVPLTAEPSSEYARNLDQVQAQAKLGNGTYKLNIINADMLDVNQLP